MAGVVGRRAVGRGHPVAQGSFNTGSPPRARGHNVTHALAPCAGRRPCVPWWRGGRPRPGTPNTARRVSRSVRVHGLEAPGREVRNREGSAADGPVASRAATTPGAPPWPRCSCELRTRRCRALVAWCGAGRDGAQSHRTRRPAWPGPKPQAKGRAVSPCSARASGPASSGRLDDRTESPHPVPLIDSFDRLAVRTNDGPQRACRFAKLLLGIWQR